MFRKYEILYQPFLKQNHQAKILGTSLRNMSYSQIRQWINNIFSDHSQLVRFDRFSPFQRSTFKAAYETPKTWFPNLGFLNQFNFQGLEIVLRVFEALNQGLLFRSLKVSAISSLFINPKEHRRYIFVDRLVECLRGTSSCAFISWFTKNAFLFFLKSVIRRNSNEQGSRRPARKLCPGVS